MRAAHGSIFHSPLSGPADLDAIIIESPRAKAVDGKTIDIYTHPLAESFKKEGRDNLTIATDVDLYEVFAASQTQISVFSTAIYEGMEFGLNTVLVDFPRVEYMYDLVEKGIAVPFEDFI